MEGDKGLVLKQTHTHLAQSQRQLFYCEHVSEPKTTRSNSLPLQNCSGNIFQNADSVKFVWERELKLKHLKELKWRVKF